MNCPWNARRSADHLQRLDGVVETSIPRSDTVVVRDDPTRTSEAAITDAVEQPEAEVGRESSRTRSTRKSDGCRCGCGMR